MLKLQSRVLHYENHLTFEPLKTKVSIIPALHKHKKKAVYSSVAIKIVTL